MANLTGIYLLSIYGAASAAQFLSMLHLMGAVFSWLLPAGVVLIIASGLEEDEARESTTALLLVAGLVTALYFAYGFAVQFGGVGIKYREPGLSGLVWLWTPLDVRWGTGWGMIGLRGFALLPPAETPAAFSLFLAFLPRAITAALIPFLLMHRRSPLWASVSGAVLSGGILYPLLGCWVWGDGWLGNLGQNLGLGHGFVDFSGAGVFLIAGAVAFAGMETIMKTSESRRSPKSPPPVHLPLIAGLGAAMVLVGGAFWAVANPLIENIAWSKVLLNGVLGSIGGSLAPALYLWFVRGRNHPLFAAEGLIAGWVATAGILAFVHPWEAFAVGFLAGILLPFVTYLMDLSPWNDAVGAISVFAVPSLVGLLSLGILADGSSGQGWNGIGAGKGVAGLLTGAGVKPDWPGQMLAQVTGVATVILLSWLLALATFGLIPWLVGRLRETFQRSASPGAGEQTEGS